MSRQVTVLLSVHNGANTLKKTFQSLVDQTYQDFDVLVIDDASTDKTGEILLTWQKKIGSERFKIIQNKTNLGLTKSLNLGLKQIKTPYTARVDCDDWWAPQKLELQMNYFSKHIEYGLLGTGYQNIGKKQTTTVVMPETDREVRQVLPWRNPFAHSCVIYKTKLVQSLGGYDESVRYGQDYDLWFRCLAKTKAGNLESILCFRRVGSGISVDKQREQMIQSIKTKLKYIRLHHLPVTAYLGIVEPVFVVLTPTWLAGLLRKIRG